DLTSLEGIQQEAAPSFEALLRAANARTPASLDALRNQVTQSVARIDSLVLGLEPHGSRAFTLHRTRRRNDPVEDPGMIGSRVAALETIEEGRRLTIQNSIFAARLSSAVEALVTESKRGVAAAADQTRSVQKLGSVTLLAVVAFSLISSVLIGWLYVGRNI